MVLLLRLYLGECHLRRVFLLTTMTIWPQAPSTHPSCSDQRDVAKQIQTTRTRDSCVAEAQSTIMVAVAVAAALGCSCDIYTDVDGVYTTDPRIESRARRLTKVS